MFSKRYLYAHGWVRYLLVMNGQCAVAIRLPPPSAAVTAYHPLSGRGKAGTKFLFHPRWRNLRHICAVCFLLFNSGVCSEPCRKETWVAKELWLLRHQLLAGNVRRKGKFEFIVNRFKIHCLSNQKSQYLKSSYPEFLWLVRNRLWLEIK